MASHINKSKKKFQPKGQTRREPTAQILERPSEDGGAQIEPPSTIQEASRPALSTVEANPILAGSAAAKPLGNVRTSANAQLGKTYVEKNASHSSARRPTRETIGSAASQTNTHGSQSQPSASARKKLAAATQSSSIRSTREIQRYSVGSGDASAPADLSIPRSSDFSAHHSTTSRSDGRSTQVPNPSSSSAQLVTPSTSRAKSSSVNSRSQQDKPTTRSADKRKMTSKKTNAAEPTVNEPAAEAPAHANSKGATQPKTPAQKRKRKAPPLSAEGSGQVASAEGSASKRRKTATKRRTKLNETGGSDAQAQDEETVISGEDNTARPNRRRRKSSGTPGRKRQLTPDNAEELTITATELKMSELCQDRQQGKLSSREQRLRDRDKDLAEKKKQAAQEKARQQAQEFMENPEGSIERSGTTEEPPQSNSNNAVRATPQRSNQEADNESTPMMTRIVNGQIVPIESSYIINRHQQANNLDPDDSVSVTVEDDLTKRINSATYMKQRRPSARWTADMDELFYDGLRYFGIDFTMIQTLFPKKSRHQIKLKFNKEQRADLNFINQVLQERKPVPDAEELQKRSGKQLREPSEVYEELAENEAQLREAHNKEEEAQKEAQRKRDQQVEEEGARLGAAIASKKARQRAIEINSDSDSDTDSDADSNPGSQSAASNDAELPSTKPGQDEQQEVEEDSDFDSDDAMNDDAPNKADNADDGTESD